VLPPGVGPRYPSEGLYIGGLLCVFIWVLDVIGVFNLGIGTYIVLVLGVGLMAASARHAEGTRVTLPVPGDSGPVVSGAYEPPVELTTNAIESGGS
jgi:hypothetical protein